ncbi:MAG TPA: protein-glutamate O-methyltransferase CheR [Anaeromyxobacteraceae bacterium]|jgi:chemotaxis protein methyltransferase CheR|nr:protein-glutamate O-methyltransferase CheR [Anaeromyxobacteraceae bacterium]
MKDSLAHQRDDRPPTSDSSRLIGDWEFSRFQALIHQEAGIWLAPAKKALLVGRLGRRLRELSLSSYAAYLERVRSDEAELVHMLDCITTNETGFFREPRHFELLEEQLFPRWRAEAKEGRRPRRARIWSAGCSTGEEPYSLAMALLQAFPRETGWQLEILATDLSTRVLERARAGVFPLERTESVPRRFREAFLPRASGGPGELVKAAPALRELVRFARLNLNDASYPALGRFDLIFCRNVLIYFDPSGKEQVVGRLLGHLDRDGHLFLGHAESLTGTAHPVRSVIPTVYVQRARPGAPPLPTRR